MPPKLINRSGRFYFDRIKALLIGDSKPCSRFLTFQELHDAVGSKNQLIRNRAFECLYDRYLQVASSEAARFKLRDEAKAAEALDRVFVTMHQRISTKKLTLANEAHMGYYIKLGIRYRLTTEAATDRKMPLLHADDLNPILTAAGVQAGSEWQHMEINEAVERALQEVGPICQKKLLLWKMGYSHEEIAAELSITPQSAKNGLYRCRLALRNELLKLDVYVQVGKTG